MLLAPFARAQILDATLISSLIATQGETITYTAVVTNRTSNAVSGVRFSDTLDPNTRFVPGSINTSPLAFPDSFAALGNVQITILAPALLTNDVDVDGVGPELAILAATTTSANGGDVTITANGGFTYNPPRGFEGIDTFTYQLNDGEGFTDIGSVSITVTGMIWFVNSAAPVGGDGRLTSPYRFLLDLADINNGLSNNPAASDTIFLYTGNYAGWLTLLNNQKFIGQGSSASLTALTGLVPPPGSLPLPATGGVRPRMAGVILASDNLVRGLNIVTGGMVGGGVGAFTASEMAVTNHNGIGINLTSGALNVVLDSVTVNGGPTGIRLTLCTGTFTVTGDGAQAPNGTGGTLQSVVGHGVYLDRSSTTVSLARMNINTNGGNGLFGVNVTDLSIDWCTFNNNGDATGEAGIRLGDPLGLNGFSGRARIANSLVRASGEMNIAVYNSTGTLAQLEVTNVISKDTRTRPLGADGLYFETRGNAVATVNVSSCSFSNNFTQGIQASALGQSALTVNVANCGFTNNNEGVVLANATDADLTFDINNNRFFNNLATGASGSAIAAVNGTTVTPLATYSGRIRNNTIIGGGIDNHLIAILFAGAGNNTLQVTNNNINAANAQFSGLFLQAGETGSGNLVANVTVAGNTVSLTGALASHGLAIQSRTNSTLCAEIANNVSSTAGLGLFGINVRQRDTSTFRLPGYAGGPIDTTAVRFFLQGKNPGSTIGATVATGYSGGAPCALPPAAAPQPQFEPEMELEIVAANNDPPLQEQSETTPMPASIAGGVADVNVAIGTLPARKAITITFRALVANPIPAGICILTNQGLVTADAVSLLTDDPRTPAPLDATLTVVAMPPMVTTQPAAHVTANSATLNGAVHPCGSPTQYYFEYGMTTAYGSVTPTRTLPAGFAEVAVSAPIAGLQPGITYHFRLRGRNDFGASDGADLTFTTSIAIVQQPLDAAACVGATATFTVAANSPSVTYQWQRRLAGASAFEDVGGATAATYTTPPLTEADDGTAFRAIVSTPGTSVTSAEAFVSVIAIATPSATYDFNSGLPADTAIYGSAVISGGVLELNPNIDSQTGAFLTTDLAPGRLVRGFAATFKVQMIPGTSPPADGFSFNWATDLPNDIYAVAEEGHGSGLSVAFDTFDNIGGEAPAIDVLWGGAVIAHKPVSIPFLVRGSFVDVQIRLSADGLLDVIYACEPVFTRLPVTGYTAQMGARFGLGSRTGGLWETHSIDDLALEIYLDPEGNLPRITSIVLSSPPAAQFKGTGAPNQNYSLEASTDLATWTWRAAVLTDASGLWQTTYPVFGEPYLFYRLKAAPQFPPGLVTWYRADGTYEDSFSPNHGEPEGATAFGMGQRGQAFSLNGKDEAIVIKSDGPIPVPWTAAFWVNREDSPDVSAALISDGVSAIKLEQWPSSRQVGITEFGIADHYYTYIAPPGQWVHLTFVGTRSGTALYVDGRFSETIRVALDLPFEFIGRRETGQDRLRGLLDEITIFNRELTPVEIEELRNTTRGP